MRYAIPDIADPQVHILRESRGATLEVAISRMKADAKDVRFVALSATVSTVNPLTNLRCPTSTTSLGGWDGLHLFRRLFKVFTRAVDPRSFLLRHLPRLHPWSQRKCKPPG
jgi:hypothetical protein